MELLNIEEIYRDFQYPASFVKAVELNLLDFEFWYFMPNEQVITRINGLMERYPSRKLIPFARRDDNDDIASLRNCGIGVAVANAIEEVKEAADVIVESNDEDGVAKWIEREIL